MAKMEQIELEKHRDKLNADVRHLIGKYRTIFGWDIPDINEVAADRLILGAIREALDEVETSLSESGK